MGGVDGVVVVVAACAPGDAAVITTTMLVDFAPAPSWGRWSEVVVSDLL